VRYAQDAIEMEDQEIDLDELDAAYEQDLDKEDTQSDAKAKMHNKTYNNPFNSNQVPAA
jgi:hypothetical protein